MEPKRVNPQADHDGTTRIRPGRATLHRGAFVCSIAVTAWLLATGGCSDAEVVVAEQCPGPRSANATLAASDAGRAEIFGTSCAPCDGAGVRFDAQGCPIFVTFDSCGGDICIGTAAVRQARPSDDDGGADDDAGADHGESDAP